MKHLFFIIAAVITGAFSSCSQRSTLSVGSPDGKLNVVFQLTNGEANYSLTYNDSLIIKPSLLGFEIKGQLAMAGNFKVVKSDTLSFDETWEPVWGEAKTVRNQHKQLTVYLQENKEPYRLMNVVFRVFNDGIGFRYEFPEQENLKSFEITAEKTAFNFSKDATAWWINGEPDSDEMLYTKSAVSKIDSANTPVTMKFNDSLYISLHEAALYNYSGMRLFRQPGKTTDFYAGLCPWPDGVMVKTQTPMNTPWRTIQVSATAGGLIESFLIRNLNEPSKIVDVSYIKPMKYLGIWWGIHLGLNTWPAGATHGATTINAKRYIDFAAKHNLQGVLYEGWNKGWENWGGSNDFDFVNACDDFDIEEVVKYGKSKGVEMIAHHETASDITRYEEWLDAALAKLEKVGIHNLKTGYVGKVVPNGQYHQGQFMVEHYQRVVEKAAEHKICLDVHECIKPTGICRTWPNLMTGEGVRGSEWNAWGGGNPASHTATIPFTRMLAGPLDYTPGIFDILYTYRNAHLPVDTSFKQRVYTTISHQLALMVVLYSPAQMASDIIENYENQPAFKFIEDISTTWDDSKVLNASIGEYVTIARKKGSNWFIGSITNEDARTLQVPLSFLAPEKKYLATIYADAKTTDMKTNPTAIDINTQEVDSSTILSVTFAGSGGQAISIIEK